MLSQTIFYYSVFYQLNIKIIVLFCHKKNQLIPKVLTILDKEDAVCNVFYQFMQFVNQMLWFSSTKGNKYVGFSNSNASTYRKEHFSNCKYQ